PIRLITAADIVVIQHETFTLKPLAFWTLEVFQRMILAAVDALDPTPATDADEML
ncbi:hypothetical protein SPRG_06376, partial [Saprolegnia parasitica CBS 223.65]